MILITGGGGLLGLNLAYDLAVQGKEVLLLQRHPTEMPPFLEPYYGKQVKDVAGNILDWPVMSELMKRYSIESIVHAAAVWPGRLGTRSLHDVVSINVTATVNMLEIARIFGLRRVTFISSTTVYLDMDLDTECREDMKLPVTPPGAIPATKKASEQICSLYTAEYGLSVPIIRVSRIYGPTAHWRINPMERMVINAVEGQPADVRDTYDGTYTCTIHAKDCAKGISIIHLKEHLKCDIYNLSDGNFITYREVSDIIQDLIPDAQIDLGTEKKQEVQHPRVNIERLKAEGWTPEYADLRKGLGAYINYLRAGIY